MILIVLFFEKSNRLTYGTCNITYLHDRSIFEKCTVLSAFLFWQPLPPSLSLPAIFSANQHWSRTETQKSVGPTNTFCLPPAKLPANRIGIHRRRCLPHTKAKAQTDKLVRFKRLLCVPIMCRYMFEGSSNNKRYMAK